MNQATHQTHTFPPLYNEDSRILILGSFPSVKSREALFYYGHPQNRFWKIIYNIYGRDNAFSEEEITARPDETNINKKKEFLKKHHIALYDVIDECDIVGSSDSSISNVKPIDIRAVLENSHIERIFVNGKTAEKYYKKYLEPVCGKTALCLPSSSPANAAWSLDRLTDAWEKALKPHIKYIEETVASDSKLSFVNPSFYNDKDLHDAYLDTSGEIPLIRFKSLDKIECINACFTTLLGGISKGDLGTLNLGFARNDSVDNLRENYSIVAREMHTNLKHIVMTDQVHTTNIEYADESLAIGEECALKLSEIDGLWTDKKGICLTATFADCVPVFFVDPTMRKIALVHSGWKGTVEQISQKTVKLFDTTGSKLSDIICVIGPSMSGAFYEVTEDVISRFKEAYPEDKWKDIFIQTDRSHYHLDMWAAIYHTLTSSGISPENIHFSGICTYDNADMMFSHRRSRGMRGNENGFIVLNS